ncbi:secreted RxLR effector protein 161-like [Ricinus communis]|uniref:secreted RxLR effector protein 161-like n=1 Tax=Ricinus communis TaxID=3988 RepID=UPI00201A7D01|nr:secreted RxLR effector protein 161-like [Ricinus communis]
MKKTREDVIIVGVYVDDLILTGSSAELIKKFKQEMMQKFEMSDLGLLSYYLGIEVKQNGEAITLCQSAYARKILEKMGITDCNTCHIPMEPRCKLSNYDGEPLVDATTYRSIIRSLRYLVNTRPDLAVGVVSRYMEAPTTAHMSAVKQILRFVRGTLDVGCVYKKDQANEDLVGYSDNDLAEDTDDRKSTTGVMFLLGESPITWMSQKQRIVALSSCEAEYIAATGSACQGIWLTRLMESLRGDRQGICSLY